RQRRRRREHRVLRVAAAAHRQRRGTESRLHRGLRDGVPGRRSAACDQHRDDEPSRVVHAAEPGDRGAREPGERGGVVGRVLDPALPAGARAAGARGRGRGRRSRRRRAATIADAARAAALPAGVHAAAAFLIYNDGIDENAMLAALLLTQFVGVPFGFAFGILGDRAGAKRSVMAGLAVYAFITVLGYFMRSATHFFALALMVGMVQGGTQALSRSMFASMIPKHKSSEFFAFFGVFERYAGILGPALFAWVVAYSGTS